VHWTEGPVGTVGRANLDGTGANGAFILGAFAEGLAVDGTNIYWTRSGSNGDGIARANLDGTGVDINFIITVAMSTGPTVESTRSGVRTSMVPAPTKRSSRAPRILRD